MDQVDKCGFGTHDASWLSFYSCFDLLGLRSPRLLRPLFALSRATGWWWPFSNVCVLTDLPTRLVMRDKKLVRIDYADGLVIER